ncbi:Chondroitin synthase [Mariniflexile rhizosphaerae]|uniref:glycosyltransferase family 2 protein n=1 Tax=unclassified Mariniflexile TaxID=2643887 RepID=UPI000CB578E3|nr:glycosyltransferase family 2 protein [Mariniflexile sp. TRM1-10]AXP79277.1 Chondroitin synthase [Mariniflexile sp. TRM1-10]PLB17768.1 MAG: Glycosyl transferase, family 2 [Flavobacteriaceae bacterium FS1-H7996/R]
MKKTVVIIVTYNGMQWIERCIKSVLESAIICEIIIVDNNSSDGTTAFIKTHFPQVILLEQTKNLGFGAANNLGMSYAFNNNADYVFLLNQDAYLQSDTIGKLIEVHNGNPDYGILSPIHLNGEANKLDKIFSNYIKINDLLFYDALKGAFSKSIYEVPFVNAAAWLLPKQTLEVIGGFDPIFHHYAEDDNYCQRVIYHELKIGIVPNCYAQHDREFRQKKLNSLYNLIQRERYLKYKWANINIEVTEEIEKQKKYLKMLVLRLFFKFQYKKMLYYKKELALINQIIPEIFKSRSINSKTGKHYL